MNWIDRIKKLEAAIDAAADVCDKCGFGQPAPKTMVFSPIEFDGNGRQIISPPPPPCERCGRVPNDELKFYPITLDGDKTID